MQSVPGNEITSLTQGMPPLQEGVGQLFPDCVEGGMLLTTEARVAHHSGQREFQVIRARRIECILD